MCLAAKNLWCSILAFAGEALQNSVVCTPPHLLAELGRAQQTPPCTISCPAGFSGNKLHFQSGLFFRRAAAYSLPKKQNVSHSLTWLQFAGAFDRPRCSNLIVLGVPIGNPPGWCSHYGLAALWCVAWVSRIPCILPSHSLLGLGIFVWD